MAEIYKAANIVYAWLPSVGEENEVDEVFGFLRSFVKERNSMPLKVTGEGKTARMLPQNVTQGPITEETQSMIVDSLCVFLKLKYWTWKWVSSSMQ
jgi:hypothetical protein